MLLCAITDRTLLGGNLAAQREALLRQARMWAENGVTLVQFREKNLPVPEQIALARALQAVLRSAKTATRLVLNAPVEIALAAGVDGVHLPAEGAAEKLRALRSGSVAGAASLWVSVSCHTLAEVEQARAAGADCILFAPVFGKQVRVADGADANADLSTLPGVGTEALAAACRAAHPVPVLALGGVTMKNAAACIAAGASGIAAIRLFHLPPERWRALCAPSQPTPQQTW